MTTATADKLTLDNGYSVVNGLKMLTMTVSIFTNLNIS